MNSDQHEELRPRLRLEPPPLASATALRGGPDTLSLLRTHASRFQRQFVLDGQPVYGISVFIARHDIGPLSERGILAGKLASYSLVYRCPVSTLTEYGFDLLPSFNSPHFTLVLPSIDHATSLVLALGGPSPSRYAEPRKDSP